MGKRSDRLDQGLREFVEEQKIFFVATAAPGARINLSPKGMDTPGPEGVQAYWAEKNQLSLDGDPTGIIES